MYIGRLIIELYLKNVMPKLRDADVSDSSLTKNMNKMVIVLKRACSYVKEQSTKKTLQVFIYIQLETLQICLFKFIQKPYRYAA